MRASWLTWGAQDNEHALIKDQREKTQVEENADVEERPMWPQTAGHPELDPQNLQERRKDTALLTPSFQTSGLQSYERINFCCYKPPQFVVVYYGRN